MSDSLQPPGESRRESPRPGVAGAARAIVAAGPRALERALLDEVERLAPSSPSDLAAAPPPVRIVVPSGSLRVHLLAELARRRPAWIGVEIVTLRRLALSLYERAGQAPPAGDALLPILVRREALREPALAAPLSPLEGGFAAVVAAVRDLLDAGFESVHGRPLEELAASDEIRVALADRPRAAAVFAVAARVARALDRFGATPGATLFARAAGLVAADPERLPPARRWLVHGFADATGCALDLLERILRSAPATLFVDRPETATGSERADDDPFGAPLGARLLDPLRAAGAVSVAEPYDRAELEGFSALGESGEAREVARRIRAALAADPGLAPERIGIVARGLSAYLAALRRELETAAIPFSVEGAGGVDPTRRELEALVRVLDRGAAAEVDRAIDLLAPGLGGAFAATELRVALRLVGAATLGDLASDGELARHDVVLPIRDPGDDDGSLLRRRRFPRGRLTRWSRRARALLRAVDLVPERAPAARLLRSLGAIARTALPVEGAAAPWLASTLAQLAADLPADFVLGRDELVDLVARRLDELPELAAGGAGGGVQLLSVTAARGRTFDRLFVIGLRRGAFPRPVVEDPLLPDAVRREGRLLLPDLPVKSDGHAEERYLFDQLLAAAPRVALSLPKVSDDGSERLVSPLLDRLSWRDEATRRLREAWATPVPASAPDDAAAPPVELARRAGLARDRAAWAAALPAALAEAGGRPAPAPADRTLARHRLALIEELDPDPRTPSGWRRWRSLGPFFGRIGPLAEERLWVTRVESLVTCAWREFLARRLGLEPLPDPAGELPEPLDPRRVGDGTHRLLERLLLEALGDRAAEGEAWMREPRAVAVDFPAPPRVERLAAEVAAELLDEEGLGRWGFAPLLAAALAERAEVARADWAAGRRPVAGVELAGSADLAPWGVPRIVSFRADRVELEAGRFVLTDYKTGRARTVEDLAREGALARAVARGTSLQPAIYVAAFGGRPATGRLIALAPDGEPPPPVAQLDESDTGALAGAARAVGIAAAARAAGRFLPRLVDASGDARGPACRNCELLEACIQEDSGARGRLARWAAAIRDQVRAPSDDGEHAEAALFLLPETDSPREGGSA